MGSRFNDMILRFFRDDIGGIRITNEAGELLYEDERSARIRREAVRWKSMCPPPMEGQRGEIWDLPNATDGKPYMVTTSTFIEDGEMIQVHHFTDSSVYMELFRDMSAYSRTLKEEKDRDGLTGLNNKGKLMEMKQSLFKRTIRICLSFYAPIISAESRMIIRICANWSFHAKEGTIYPA